MFLPRGPMCQPRVETRQQLAHTGGEGHLRGFPNRPQSRLERLEDGMVAPGRQRAPIQYRPAMRPSAPDRPFATPGAAITGQGGDPQQRGALRAVQAPQRRDLCHQQPREPGADARRALEQRVLGVPPADGRGALPPRRQRCGPSGASPRGCGPGCPPGLAGEPSADGDVRP